MKALAWNDYDNDDYDDDHGQPVEAKDISIEEVLGWDTSVPPAPCAVAPKPFAKERTMNNTIKLTQFPKRGISAESLKIGEYARIISNGHIVLKTKAGVIDLSDPATVWTDPFSSPVLEKLNIGDKLEITVGMTTDFQQRIVDLGRSNKLSAIEAMREATNWGLKEAKDYVDSLLLQS